MAEQNDILQKICGPADGPISVDNVRQFVAGLDARVPLVDGTEVTYVNLDNAATTPSFIPVSECLSRYLEYYSSIHRGTGFKSLLSTRAYEKAREVVAGFIGADFEHHCVLFTQNATHALNKLASRLRLGPEDVVVNTLMEHHSNLLPWRYQPCRVVLAGIRPGDGGLDVDDLEAKVRQNAGRVKLVAVTGGSNVTGYLPDIGRIARIAHEHGAWIVLDATQLVPHRSVRLGDPDDPEHIDFLAFSAHKMYAPFGSGVLAGRKEVFEVDCPDMVGGGTVHAVTADDVVWHQLPEREEAGTPNVMGAIALARAAQVMQEMGMDEIAEHERELTAHCLRKLMAIEGLKVFGECDPELRRDRLGVFAVEAEGCSHGMLAAVLGYEWGIGVRNGCFCAQTYARKLLGISQEEMDGVVRKLAAGDHANVPGLVRISLGVYNTREEVDLLLEALSAILRDGPRGHYMLDPTYMDYVPAECSIDYERFLPV